MDDSGLKENKSISRTTRVVNALGMHARPASRIARAAEAARADIRLTANESTVDATSIIDILTLCAVKGTEVEVKIETSEDQEIMEWIVNFFEDGFGENKDG